MSISEKFPINALDSQGRGRVTWENELLRRRQDLLFDSPEADDAERRRRVLLVST